MQSTLTAVVAVHVSSQNPGLIGRLQKLLPRYVIEVAQLLVAAHHHISVFDRLQRYETERLQAGFVYQQRKSPAKIKAKKRCE